MDYTEIVKHMSLREQARLVTGADFWHTWAPVKYGMPSIMVSDGPNGLRKQEKGGIIGRTIEAICFPSAAALSSSWDRGVMSAVGSTLADECIANRVSVLLGPGINIKRSPLCGRNFEYYSEDPVLAGELAASLINAIQAKGVGTSLKHFAANSTEDLRMVSNSVVDERALREIYLRGFEIAVKKAQPWTVMLAYNKLNGDYCTENEWLVEGVLRQEWGFQGLTVSDWTATNDRAEGLNCGLDLEMPGSGFENVRKLAKAFRRGMFSLETLERSATRVAELVNKAEPLLRQPAPAFNKEADHAMAYKVATQCPVLLKNDGLLPIPAGASIAVIGERAREPLFQGAGSAQINAYKVENAWDAFVASGANVKYARGYLLKSDEPNEFQIKEAVALAKQSNVAVVFVSCSVVDACEGTDRKDMTLPLAHTELIKAVCSVNPNTVVVVASGSAVEMPWVNYPKAILQSHFLGEASGPAIVDILLGKISPSGKLSETYPVSFADTPCPECYKADANKNVVYKESIFVGYRYYDKANVPVLFPFGHGLTYTTFSYSNLKLSATKITPDDTLSVTFTIGNVGSIGAAEVAQVYVGMKDSYVFRAPKELKDFVKVYIEPGTQQTLTLQFDRSAFEYYSKRLHAWVVEPGVYEIMVGSSSADIRLKAELEIQSNEANGELDYMELAPRYWNGDIKNADIDDFADILGAYPEDFAGSKSDDRLTVSNCLFDAADTPAGQKLISLIQTGLKKALENDPALYEVAYNSIMSIPFNRFPASSSGIVSDAMVEALVHYLNSGELFESAMVAAAGIPDAFLNIFEKVMVDFIEKKSRC